MSLLRTSSGAVVSQPHAWGCDGFTAEQRSWRVAKLRDPIQFNFKSGNLTMSSILVKLSAVVLATAAVGTGAFHSSNFLVSDACPSTACTANGMCCADGDCTCDLCDCCAAGCASAGCAVGACESAPSCCATGESCCLNDLSCCESASAEVAVASTVGNCACQQCSHGCAGNTDQACKCSSQE